MQRFQSTNTRRYAAANVVRVCERIDPRDSAQ
jgi:hypothetical protein